MSLINTRIQNIRAKGNLDKNEIRPSRYGALNLFMRNTDMPGGIITQELKDRAEKSIGNTFETPVIDFDAGVTIGNVRNAIIADDENTSQMFVITFATYAWGFTMVPALFMNNEISMQQDFEKKFQRYLYKFGETLDSAAIAALEAAKTQVFNDSLTYTVTANELISAFAERENVIGDLNPIMAANDHFGIIHIVGNAGIESIVQKLAQKDIFNSENKTLEYSDKELHFSTRIPNDAGEYANLYAVEEGAVGMLTRFEREALLGTKTADGHEWSIDTLPMLNMPVGTYFYESVGDFSGIAGASSADLTRAYKQHYGFAVDVAFLTPYNSDPATIANPIAKAVVTTT
jgi:hypothetical protein